MDIYLPADFHELHDTAPDDWRDISTSCATRERLPASNARRDAHTDPANDWQAL